MFIANEEQHPYVFWQGEKRKEDVDLYSSYDKGFLGCLVVSHMFGLLFGFWFLFSPNRFICMRGNIQVPFVLEKFKIASSGVYLYTFVDLVCSLISASALTFYFASFINTL